ncbi:MAG: FkbM family methyltransferase [Caulobacter sp.]|nr:FkbM family methyltransferase [Caulobacter sp.]
MTESAAAAPAKGGAELRRQNWGGVKPHVKRILGAPVINPALHAVAKALSLKVDRLPVRREAVSYRMYGGGAFEMLDPMVCQVAHDLYWGEGRFMARRDRLFAHAMERLNRDGDAFVDAGAYTGFHSMLATASNPALRARAFEIVPQTFGLIGRNAARNGVSDRVDIRLCGLGEEAGEIHMPEVLDSASLPSGLSLESNMGGGVTVPVSTLDAACADLAGQVTIKIDVEGLEGAVARGGQGLFARLKPDLMCEISTHARQFEPVTSVLAPLGYRFYRFTDAGLVEATTRDPNVRGRDWLMSARDDLGELITAVNATE